IQSLEQKNTLYQAQLEQAKQAYEQLQFAYKLLLRQRFGQKSERHIDSESRQLSLFEDDAFNQKQQDTDEPFITIEQHQRRKKTKVSFPEHLPRKEIIIQVNDEHRQCHCGLTKHCIGYETHEILNYIPAVYEIIEQKREKLACPKGCTGAIITAEQPQHILPKTKASESLLAHIVISKLQDRQPLYHLEKQLKGV
ncbi:MAG: IS66 family transposase zinc-finger binding domain-containing protein, partial [Anaerobacillus sp.]